VKKVTKSTIVVESRCTMVNGLLVTHQCESWTLRENEETRFDAFEMKILRKILRVNSKENK